MVFGKGVHKGYVPSTAYKKGHQQSEEIRKKKSEAQKGEKNHFYGKHHTEESKRKNSEAHKGNKNYNYGKHLSKEYKIKISEALNGCKKSEETKKKISESLKGNIPWNKGKVGVYSEQTLRKMSGKNSYNWLGGKSFEPYDPSFNKALKRKIKMRDNFTCQLCEIKQDLAIHHIDYNKKNSHPKNLITLCRICNSKVNNNRSYWKKYWSS